jgi:hypothetical protein
MTDDRRDLASFARAVEALEPYLKDLVFVGGASRCPSRSTPTRTARAEGETFHAHARTRHRPLHSRRRADRDPGDAHAALTTPKCLVSKPQAWSTLRKCEAAEHAKQIASKPGDLATCTSKFRAAMAKIDAKAAKAAIACRFRDNGHGTITGRRRSRRF